MTKDRYWIVDESGDDVEIIDGRDKYGCTYQSSADGRFIERIHNDGEGCWVTGEFDRHDRPYSEKEKA